MAKNRGKNVPDTSSDERLEEAEKTISDGDRSASDAAAAEQELAGRDETEKSLTSRPSVPACAADISACERLITRLIEEVEAEYPQATDGAKWRLVEAQLIIALAQGKFTDCESVSTRQGGHMRHDVDPGRSTAKRS